MPELPDIEAYLHALRARMVGRRVARVLIASPFVLRSVDPPVEAIEGLAVAALARLGKRIVIEFDARPPLFAVIHLMVAGRIRWDDDPLARGPARITLAALGFDSGTLIITEAGTRKRASLTMVRGRDALGAIDPGGVDPFDPGLTARSLLDLLRRQNRTLKRALTDPHLLSGIGNAYSDEILHGAKLSPILLTGRLNQAQAERLLVAMRGVLGRFAALLRERFEKEFPGPGGVTAFRPEFAAHGKFGKACPACGTAIQRIVHADHETNYCPGCQTGGRVLADRSLSRLLKGDWPRTVEQWEDERRR